MVTVVQDAVRSNDETGDLAGRPLLVESRFATVRNRSKITKGPGSRAAGIAMALKLIEAAEQDQVVAA